MLATNRLNGVPVAMPLTPPSRFCNAIMLALMNALKIAGTSARAKSSAAACECNKLSMSSHKTHKRNTDGAVRTQLANFFKLNQFQLAFLSSFLGFSPFQFLHGVLIAGCQ